MEDDNNNNVGKKVKEEAKAKVKAKVKAVAKKYAKIIGKKLLPVVLVIILLASFVYFITIDDGTYKEDDWSSTPYAAGQYTNNVTINNSGNINASMTAQELWDKMVEEGGRVGKYLDSPEQLLKLMNAETITQFLDTRNNPDDAIDWDSINSNIQSKDIQGIIKLKRETEGKTSTMIYTDNTTFNSYIDIYNDNSSTKEQKEKAKQNALSHFTLENQSATDDNGNATTEYYAKVATWSETVKKVEAEDPDEKSYENYTYNMTTTKINYRDLVKSYTMPFDYLWQLMVISEDYDFVSRIADLVYGSKMEITVYDNLTTNTDIDVYSYTKKEKIITNYKASAKSILHIDGTELNSVEENPLPKENENRWRYTTTTTNITKTNTLEIAVTLADVWYAKYEKKYKNNVPEVIKDESIVDKNSGLDDIDYDSKPSETTSKDIYSYAKDLENQCISKVKQKTNDLGYIYSRSSPTIVQYNNQDINLLRRYYYISSSKTVSEDIYRYAYVNREETYTNTIEKNQYISSPMTNEEKTDKNSTEPNFVTILSNYENTKARNNILGVKSWFLELVEENKNTVDMLDLTKYLLYKVTDKDYGIPDWDFTIYADSTFNEVTELYNGTVQEKVWYALKDFGYSDFAIAGAMGNIHYESGSFNPKAIEYGYDEDTGGIGLCQWTNYPRASGNGRNAQLKKYAESKGVSWKDEDTQVEFLVSEITGEGAAKDYTNKQLADKRSTYGNELAYPDGWKNATSVEDATIAFCYSFERPNKKAAEASMNKRQNWAKTYYNQFKDSGTGGKVSKSDESSVKCYYTNAKGKKFTILDQTKITDWGGRCNRAACAIIASGYTDKTPSQLINDMNNSYKGDILTVIPNDSHYFGKYGLHVELHSSSKDYNYMESLKSQLKSGGYAMLWLKRTDGNSTTYIGKSGTQWTSKFHWIAVIDYKKEKEQDKICVADWRGITWVDIDEFAVYGVQYSVYVYVNEQ